VCACVGECFFNYYWLNTHAPLQRSNTTRTCFILPLCYFFVVGDAETNSVNGFPLQVSLLHCYILGTYTPKVYNICSRYSRSKFIDFINGKNDFRCFDIISCLLAGQVPDFKTFRLNISLCVCSIEHWFIKCSMV